MPGSLRSIFGSTFRGLRLRVPSGIWIDRKRWGKKNDINIPNIPGEERNALLSKRAKLKEQVDVIEHTIGLRQPMINRPLRGSGLKS